MKAVQFRTLGGKPEVVDVEKPSPGPGQILLKMTAAGLCHSDVWLMSLPKDMWMFGPLPMTLGHEGAGIVEELGTGVTNVAIGQNVVVYGPWGCGDVIAARKGKRAAAPKLSNLASLRQVLEAQAQWLNT